MINKQIVKAVKVVAPEINMEDYLEEGEIDVSNIPLEKINQTFDISEMKKICRKTKCFLYPFGPIGLFRTNILKKNKMKVFEARRSSGYESLSQVIDFLKSKKRSLIYQVIHNTIHDKYIVRYFNVKCSFIMYWFNRIFVWKNILMRKKN